ncbi:MAG: patatin family protein [Akkermansia sp.]|nr:patatin family protein [Akkermansia sp.]
MKTGLILEGGAMRGLFTVGVLDVFMEQGICVDAAIGVSAGAAFGVNYKSGQVGRALRYNTRFCNDSRYCGWRCFLRDGNIFSRDFAYDEVPLKHDPFDFEAYSRNPMPFYLVCTDVETGEPVYHQYKGKEDHLFEWIRASASMPLVSQFVEIEGRKLLDGGITDSIPLRYFENMGYKRNIVILTQPPMFEKKENSLLFLIRLKYRKYPHLVRAMEQRHIVYNETLRYIEQKEQQGDVLLLRPESPLPVSRVEKNPHNLHQAYKIGRELALSKLALIREYLDASR